MRLTRKVFVYPFVSTISKQVTHSRLTVTVMVNVTRYRSDILSSTITLISKIIHYKDGVNCTIYR